MARKRLSDLLREEVHKTEDAEATPATTSGKRTGQTNRAKAQASSGRAKSPVVETVEAVLVEDTQTATEKDDMHQLKQELARSQQREAHLQQELTLLQTELDQREALINSLEADLEKAKSFKNELDQAKKAALKLAEENTRLNEELKSLQRQKPTVTTEAKPVVAAQSQSPIATTIDVLHERQARSLAHPVFPAGSSPGYLSDQDLGWVD